MYHIIKHIFFLLCLTPLLNAQEPQANYQQALKLFQKGAFRESILVIRKVIDTNGKSYRLHYLAAYDYWRLGNLHTTKLHLKAAKKLDDSKKDIWIDLIKIHIMQKKYSRAMEICLAGQKKFPQSIELELLQASILSQQKKHKQALKKVEKIKSEYSSDYRPLLLESKLYFNRKRYEKAEMSLKWAEKMVPKNAIVKNNLGLIHEKLARKMIRRSKKARKNGQEKKADSQKMEAHQKLERAISLLEQAIALQNRPYYQKNLQRCQKLLNNL